MLHFPVLISIYYLFEYDNSSCLAEVNYFRQIINCIKGKLPLSCIDQTTETRHGEDCLRGVYDVIAGDVMPVNDCANHQPARCRRHGVHREDACACL